jgi:hypothetical protein
MESLREGLIVIHDSKIKYIKSLQFEPFKVVFDDNTISDNIKEISYITGNEIKGNCR